VIHVDDTALGGDDGTSWTDAFVDLQDALAAAGPGVEIWVAEGLYTPSDGDATASFVLPSGVRLYGGFAGWESALEQRDWAAHPTELSGDVGRDDVVGSGTFWYAGWDIGTANAGHVIDAGGTGPATVVDGFVISNGHTGPAGTSAGDPLMWGGGIHAPGGSPTVRNCTFTHCLAAWGQGAGIYAHDGSPRIESCRFVENYVHSGSGAGVAVTGAGSLVLLDCELARNHCVATSPSGAQGGGVYYAGAGPARIERCVFDGNVCRSFFAVGDELGYGGGLSTWGPATVRDCLFTGNQAHLGGGLAAWATTRVVQGVFVDNLAVPLPNDPYPEQGGVGAGLLAYSFAPMELYVEGCTVAHNHGKKHVGLDALGAGAHMTIENSIVWGNTGTSPEVLGYWPEQLEGAFDAAWSCIEHVFGPQAAGEDPIDPDNLPGCLELDPLLVSPSTGDLRLAAGSPCADAGNNGLVQPDVPADHDGLPRFVDDPQAPDVGQGSPPLVDMGAYERP